MKPEDHSLLSQLVQLGLAKLAEQASAILNEVEVEKLDDPPADDPPTPPNPEG